ncbi:Hydrogen peroxide-inducible genes activator [Methyloligella halotolerans]|uniref:Hydrogen peroxide-inducible genes activator n=1 Tax=Methyloligella halotolerans TaxID=1177755 RepID=A0A1E2S3E4_9HYPH|nr:LysR substrate-binding domain-containing protein [Methyloligella halotolerans]ODA69027.1 Hydrogen peroxide-inducible genes activator [Methyloligella halotolerans]
MLTLRQLRYLRALSQHGHFGRAAVACAVSQPALSMQIKELEKELGVALVERTHREIRLTGEGREIARRAEAILLQVRDLTDYAAERRSDFGTSLTLGVIPTVGPYFLPTVLPRLQRQYPKLELRLHETRTETLIEGLLAGDLDAAILALPIPDTSLESMPLFEDRFLFVTGDETEPRRSLRLEDLQSEQLLLLEEGHCLRDQALALCSAAQPAAMRRFGATSLATLLQMVASGYGTTLVPEIAVQAEVRPQSGLRLLRFKTPEPSRTIGLTWRATSPRKPQMRKLGLLLKETWRDYGTVPDRRRAAG